MYSLMSTPFYNFGFSKFPLPTSSFNFKYNINNPKFLIYKKALQIQASATNEVDTQTETAEKEPNEQLLESKLRKESNNISSNSFPSTAPLDKDLKKTVATFARRASTATKNPVVLGTALSSVFEVQGYVPMVLGGALSFNLIFPSNEPDI